MTKLLKLNNKESCHNPPSVFGKLAPSGSHRGARGYFLSNLLFIYIRGCDSRVLSQNISDLDVTTPRCCRAVTGLWRRDTSERQSLADTCQIQRQRRAKSHSATNLYVTIHLLSVLTIAELKSLNGAQRQARRPTVKGTLVCEPSKGSATGKLDGRRNLSIFQNTEIGDLKACKQQRPQTLATSPPATAIIAEQKISHSRMHRLWPQSANNTAHRRAKNSRRKNWEPSRFFPPILTELSWEIGRRNPAELVSEDHRAHAIECLKSVKVKITQRKALQKNI